MVVVRASRVWLGCILLTAACGGAPGSGAKSGDANKSNAPTADNVSIGDTAAAQGGLASLGGGANRSAGAGALASSLRLDLIDKDSPVKLDGVLKEWPARTAVKTPVKGTLDDKTSFAVAVQYDDTKIYVGGEVADDGFVRTSRFGDSEDHASLTIAFPVGSGGALVAYEVSFFAGRPGETTGAVKFTSGSRRGQEVAGARIVEAPAGGGYTFEASIPWSAFPEGRLVRVGLRGVARYYDSDSLGTLESIIATAPGDAASAASLPSLPTDPEQAMIEGLLAPKGLLAQAAKFDVVADVAGDAMKERIAVFDRYLTICGPSYRQGREYFFRDLGGDLMKLDAREVTGRNKEDLLLRRRFSMQGTDREWFEVWSIMPGSDEPVATFGQEIAVISGAKHLDNAVHVAGREIEVSVEPAVGWDATTYREPIASDVGPILFPWGAVKSRTFRFDGSRFLKAKEVAQAPAPGVTVPGQPAPPDTYVSTLAAARAQEPPTPSVKKGGDLGAQVLALYKRDHNVPEGTAARVDLQVQAAGDARPERVVLVGRDIVVLGPGFKNGTGYASITLNQFTDPSDVKDVSARDLNGDGAADLVVRGVRHVTAAGSSEPLDIEAMFVYEIKNDALSRIFAIETAREQGQKRIQGLVQFVPASDHKQFEIDVRPGIAKGWTEKSYPWAQEQPQAGALEPLLLPWGGIASLRYAWSGTAFSLKP
jgi:hypothetical protein